MTYKVQTVALTVGVSMLDINPPNGDANWHIERMMVTESGSYSNESVCLNSIYDPIEGKNVSYPSRTTSEGKTLYLVILWKQYSPKQSREDVADVKNPEAITW